MKKYTCFEKNVNEVLRVQLRIKQTQWTLAWEGHTMEGSKRGHWRLKRQLGRALQTWHHGGPGGTASPVP